VTNIVPLNKEAHRTLRVQPTGGEDKNFVAVVVNEFSHLVLHYPILFSKDPETGAFYCGAMLGIDTGENLFRDEGTTVYRPLTVQRGPFYIHADELAIDLDHPRVGGGQPLFTESGEPTAYLKSIMGLFRDLVPGMERTKVFITTLLNLKLIEPMDVDLAFDDGSKRRLEGLYTINGEALRALPDADALDLFKRGYLQLIYLMMASIKQIPALAQKKNNSLSNSALAGALG
jgi:hypothetical protein